MYGQTGKYDLYFDISATETADYQKLCPMSVDFDLGEELDTWFDLCYKNANNVKTAIDPTWSVSFKFNSSDAVAKFILEKEFAVGADATCGARIVNLNKGTAGKQIDFTCTISNIAYSPVTEEVLEVSFDIKVYDNSTFVEVETA